MRRKRSTQTPPSSSSRDYERYRRPTHERRPSDAGAYERPAPSRTRRSARDYALDTEGEASPERQYSRRGASQQYQAKLHKKRRRHRILKRMLIAVLVVLGLGAGGAFAYINYINGNFSNGLGNVSNVLTKTSYNKPFYMLLMGTDQSIQRDESNATGGTYRTDTIMLARIDPTTKKVTLISMPRDTKVELAGHGTQKLNAAYAFGGSELAVSTVSDLAGVDLSHFALVDMDGLKATVDALGGIDVNVPIEIDDDMAGGHLDAGEQTLNGDQALILCRSRHAYDDYGDGDAYRAANQRMVIQAIAQKLLASDAVTIASTVSTLSQYVQTDMTVNDIVGLAQQFQGFDAQNNLYSASMPTHSDYIDKVWYEIVEQDAWKAMMARVDAGESPTEETEVDKSTGTVLSNAGDQDSTSSSDEASDSSSDTNGSANSKAGTICVRNGSGTKGVANEVAKKLENAGYTVADTANADSFNYQKTLVVYADSGNAAEAKAIASTIGESATAKMNDGSYSMKGDFLVVIGADYK